MVVRHGRGHSLMDDDPLQFVLWLIGYRLRNHLYVIKAAIIIVVSYLQIFNLICIKDIILYKNISYLEYLPGLFMQQPGCFGLVMTFVYIKDIFQYQEILFNTFWSISSCGKRTRDRILRESKIIKLMCIINYGLCILLYFSLFPLVGDEKRFIFAVMYSTEHLGRWSTVFIFIFYLCSLVIAYGAVCPLFGAVYVVFHARFQLYLITIIMREIPKQDLGGGNRLRTELKRQSTIYKTLAICAKQHAVMKMVTTTFLQKTQNIIMLVFNVFGTLAFVSAACFLIFEISPSSNWRMMLTLAGITTLFLTFCICGQKIADESNHFFVTLCNTPWHHWNHESKMALGMMLTNSLEPLKVSCFGLVDLNYGLILLAVRIVYSLLALSRKFK